MQIVICTLGLARYLPTDRHEYITQSNVRCDKAECDCTEKHSKSQEVEEEWVMLVENGLQ